MSGLDEAPVSSSVQSFVLDLPPSCIEFCPAFPSYFLVGTYNLQKDEASNTAAQENDESESDDESRQAAVAAKPQNRNGSILVYQLVNDTMVHVQTEMQPSALLDLRFNPVEGKRDLCAVVSSTATLALFRMTPGEGQEKPLKHIKTMDMTSMLRHADDSTAETEVLFTAFSWHPTRGDLVAITTTSGHVYLVDLGPDLEGEWQMHPEPVITHSLEAWCVVIHPPFGSATSSSEDTFELFSGGDDSALRYASCDRIPEEGNLSGTRVDYQLLPLGANTKSHGAGVVAILPLRVVEDGTNAGIYTKLYVTGSYDDNIRLFSSQNPRSPLVESNLGGGVWRLKLIDMDQQDPSDGKAWRARILVSCMHAGVRVVELIKSVTGEWEFRVIGRFEEHKSMNYGSDFVHDVVADELTVVSTSFYDKLLCLWKLNMSKDKKLAEKTEGMSLQ